MKRIAFLLVVFVTLGGVVAFRAPASGQTDAEAAPSYGTKIPAALHYVAITPTPKRGQLPPLETSAIIG